MKTKLTLSRCMIAILCLGAFLGGCGYYSYGDIQSLIWNTSGGGDLVFTITKDDALYQIQVSQYEFKETDLEISLSEEDGDVYFLVDNIFNKKRNLFQDTLAPGGETGSWTSITLVFEDLNLTIKNIDLQGELKILYEFITEKMPALQ